MTISVATSLDRLARVVHNDAHTAGLKPVQWEALRYLSKANKFSRSPGALTSFLGTTKGTVSQTLQVLQRKELVEKSKCARDQRSVSLILTDKAERLLEIDPLREVEKIARSLSYDRSYALERELESLMLSLVRRRGGKPFGVCQSCQFFRDNHDEGDPHFCSLLKEPLSETDAEKTCVEQS